jgi:type II secretory pathway pseudopilin PulG
MPELSNSQRVSVQATYTPLKSTRRNPPTGPPDTHRSVTGSNGKAEWAPQRPWEKWSFIATLNPSSDELAKLNKLLSANHSSDAERPSSAETVINRNSIEQALDVIGSALAQSNGTLSPSVVAPFRNIDAGDLSRIGRALLDLRSEGVDALLRSSHSILNAFHAAHLPAERLQASPTMDLPITDSSSSSVGPQSVTTAYRPELGRTNLPLQHLISWAIERDVEPDAARLAHETVEHLGLSETVTVNEFRDTLRSGLDTLAGLVRCFDTSMAIEPIGLLHLERIGYTPAGIERGELLHSVPLAPAEEVNISHREWSNTSQEFQTLVTDFMENYSEEGVTEKSELAQATSSQQQHSSGLNTTVSASGGYGPVNISTSASYNVADSASTAESFSRRHSSETTRKASSRVTQEHKVSFRVASAAGTEDQAVQKFVNPSRDRATRVDYYQLVRKWRVDLYRYGLRLTYDVTIPDPGSDIISRILEMRSIRDQLEQGFDWNRLPSDINRDNYLTLAAQYGAAIPSERSEFAAPPQTKPLYLGSEPHNWTDEQSQQNEPRYFTLEIDVPEGYVVQDASHLLFFQPNTDENWRAFAGDAWGQPPYNDPPQPVPLPEFTGQSGRLILPYGGRNLRSLYVEVRGTFALTPEAYAEWQLRVWNVLRSAAQTRYNEHLDMLRERLSRLSEELGAQDPLSLRKAEREEVMKGALRWLFGPTFRFVPSGVTADLYNGPKDSTTSPAEAVKSCAEWRQVLSQGELIKFLQEAVEWENMLYFLYPYFWSNPTLWEAKKYLDHPDPMHRVFLRAGAARVVLTIRPGFEVDFVQLLETSGLGQLTGGHPYLTIAEEMRAYAQTNYPGLPAANAPTDARPLLYARQRQAWEYMQVLIKLLEAYRQVNARYPSTAEGLMALRSSVPLRDPWNNPYAYTSPGTEGDYDLVSFGADGAPGGSGENADIGSQEDGSRLASNNQRRAWNEMQALINLLEAYRQVNGRYPTTAEGLVALQASVPLRDPWNNPYAYTNPGAHGDYDLISYGADGTLGGSGESADITSWAEASLIATWHDYTPTSALDIGIDEILPDAEDVPTRA